MAEFLSCVVVALALSTMALGQSSSSPSSPGAQPAPSGSPATSQAAAPRIAPGSVIPVQLTTTVDAKKAKTGEEVTAKVTEDLKTSNGMMLMPKDTEIVGHITEAQSRSKQEKESQVGIVFDHAVLNNSNISYPLSIQAVISPQIFHNPNGANNANGGPPEAPSSPSAGAAPGSSPGGVGHGMGGGGQAAPPNGPPGGGGGQTSGSNKAPAITGNTQGVVGFEHLKLETPTNATQPSVISSEKNNVKLENGTLMLLRVNQ